jgi:hypothetical protein
VNRPHLNGIGLIPLINGLLEMLIGLFRLAIGCVFRKIGRVLPRRRAVL